jgi:hypothetical protein
MFQPIQFDTIQLGIVPRGETAEISPLFARGRCLIDHPVVLGVSAYPDPSHSVEGQSAQRTIVISNANSEAILAT